MVGEEINKFERRIEQYFKEDHDKHHYFLNSNQLVVATMKDHLN